MMLSRRRFLTITAAAALAPHRVAADTIHRRTGRALGAPTSLQLVNTTAAEAEATFTIVEAELARLERIFSLYDPKSALSTLNMIGTLENPPAELLEVLSLCTTLHHATDRVFDPTIQPLWAHHAGLSPIDDAQDLIGWRNVQFDSARITFAKPNMQLTLNGIAQGYITDRIAVLLRARGLTQVMIDMGEVAALGANPDNMPWNVGIASAEGDIVARVQLADRALATSATEGLILDRRAGTGHILHPLGLDAPQKRLVAVSSPFAAIADGLSTAGCLLTKHRLLFAIKQFPKSELEIFV